MKKFALTAMVAAVTLVSASAMAADMARKGMAALPPPPPPSPWDLAFGASLATDYIWRGITQSAHQPSVSAYTELRYNINPSWQLYGGVAGNSIKFPNNAAGEFDLFGGVRPTFGPLALDFGFQYYYYPGGQCFAFAPVPAGCFPTYANFVAKQNWSFWEVYNKGTWTVNDQWALGYTVFGTSNILNTGASGTYLSGSVKYTAPSSAALWGSVGWFVSAEVGHQWLGTSDAFYGTAIAGNPFQFGTPYEDYLTWNVGLAFTWKVFTLDLRYYDTNLSAGDCAVYTSDNTAILGQAPTTYNPAGVTSKWCDARFVAKLSFDMTLGALK